MRRLLQVFLSAVLTLAFLSGYAQDRTISGRVTSSEDGSALPGVNVIEKGTTNGTATDADGRYSISVSNSGAVLVFTFIGLQLQEVTVGDRTVIDVAMAADVTQLSEVIVTTFGEVKRSSFTGSSATIGSEQLALRPITNAFQSLGGSAPGVVTNAGSGQPGSAPDVRIRGIGSVSSSNSPLYVVDGMPYTGNLSNISADDIETMTILKDAASTALYGARAANGVVIITTKKGKSGKPTVNVKYTKGFNTRALKEYDKVGPAQYYPLMWEANRNSLAYRATNPVPIATASQQATDNLQSLLGYNVYDVPFNQLVDNTGTFNPNANLIYSKKDLDWEDPLMRTGTRDEVAFSLSGANDRTDYFFSASYLEDQGYLIRSSFERLTARLNVNTQVNDWLKTGTILTTTVSSGNLADAAGNTTFVNPFFFSRSMGPIFPVYAHDPNNPGSFLLDGNGNRFYDYGNMFVQYGIPNRPQHGGRHAIAETQLNKNYLRRNVLGARGYLEVSFLKDFKFTVNAGTDITNLYSTDYQNPLIGDGAPAGRASHRYDYTIGLNFNQLLNYSKTFGDHTVGVTLGHESFEEKSNFLDGSRSAQILDGNVEFANFTTTTNLNSESNRRSIEGYLSRVNYDFKERYFASFSVRRDGSSKFFSDVRWGTFFSVSGAWRIDQENFMSGISAISSLKLRSSFGQTGNDGGISNYAWQPLYELGWNNASEAGILQSSLGTQILTWESSDQFDVALEYGVLNNRITGTFEYFNRASSNLIFDVPLPLSAGGDLSLTQNIGRMVNKGLEIEISAEVLKIQDFSWTINLNATKLKNEITKMPKESPEIINGTKKLKEGVSIFEFWLREYMGVSPETGEAYYRATSYVPANSVILESGDTVTTNIANARFHYAGTSIPDLAGGITNTFRYKNFTLSALVIYQLGGKVYDGAYGTLMGAGGYGSAKHPDILKRWQNPGDITNVPRMDAGRTSDFDAASDRWLTKANFFNLRNITLSYSLPKSLIQRATLSNVQVYVSGENLVFLSKRKGMGVQESFAGTTSNTFSPAKSFVTGVSITF